MQMEGSQITLSFGLQVGFQFIIFYTTGNEFIKKEHLDNCKSKQEGQRCPKSQVAQAAIRLSTAVIKCRNKQSVPVNGLCVS